MYPTRRALFGLWSILTGKTCCLVATLLKADCSTTSALPIAMFDTVVQLPFGQKIGTFFVRTGSKVKPSRAIVNARRGFPKGAALVREQPASAPLWSPSFGTFLGETRKVHYRTPETKKERGSGEPLPLKFMLDTLCGNEPGEPSGVSTTARLPVSNRRRALPGYMSKGSMPRTGWPVSDM